MGEGVNIRVVQAEFGVLQDSTIYNVILGRKMFNDLCASISTKFFVMNFLIAEGRVATIRGDRISVVKCNKASLTLRDKAKESIGVFLIDLDSQLQEKPRPKPNGLLERFQIGDVLEKYTMIKKELPYPLKSKLQNFLRGNVDLFSWELADMLEIDPTFMFHQLAINLEFKPVAQQCRKMSPDRAAENFLDAYSGYNQIPMHKANEDKTAFINPEEIYCYTIMPFGLKM
ncbi:uncharacterized protein LOC107647276 [Arachis ipaensis]|uniref:uncharacterized protein LOC107647276 n=1 Tax=Arachis ipaensis TaxID=130454 RepID=UPI0007AFD480|nr:uncharacterized protein LOC107647276 [Arachis ipaensis]XP_025661908.1 uncharacterized protein LOC112757568 [Arachis hypogaea]